MKTVWTPEAAKNVAELREYIAKDKPESARRTAERILETVSLLSEHPHLGKPSLVDGFREIQVAGLPFVIPYKVQDNRVIIVRVFHNKQRPVSWTDE